jgi:hypothetical protein
MGITLWSRKEGLVRPPAEPLHAQPGSSDFPRTFRTRVAHWMNAAFQRISWGNDFGDVSNDPEHSVRKLFSDLCAAYGRLMLAPSRVASRPLAQVMYHVLHCPDTEVMDVVDAVFQESAYFTETGGGAETYDEQQRLTDEINTIFREEGVGYRRVGDRLVRFDTELTHHEAIVPALQVLATGRYGEARAEFDDAVAAFGRGRWRDVLTHANAAFESVLKIVTGEKGDAGDLIKAAKNTTGLIPNYLGGSVDSFAGLMHGLPAARGQQGSAHGLADSPVQADEHLARLMLTVAASLIVFLTRERRG